MQMLISSLVEHPGYSEVVYRGAWKAGANGSRVPPPSPPRTAVPSISRLQLMVEHAWKMGFDTQVLVYKECYRRFKYSTFLNYYFLY